MSETQTKYRTMNNREILLSELAEVQNRLNGLNYFNPPKLHKIKKEIAEIETRLQIINLIEKENWC